MDLLKIRSGRGWFRRAYLLPAEHGSWAWLLIPYLVGAIVASRWSPATLLVLLGGLSAFLLRQPASMWLRIRQGRGRRADEPVVAFGSGLLFSVSVASLAALHLLQRLALLWLLLPVTALFVVYLVVAQINRARIRNLWMEIAGAVGLALMAPAAYIASRSTLDEMSWLLWILMAAQNSLGVFYVRQRIADNHSRPGPRTGVLVSHVVGVVVLMVALSLMPQYWPVLIPFFFFLARAVWIALQSRPVGNVKRFGFTEVGIELLAAAWFVGVFLMT